MITISKQLELIGVESLQALQINGIETIRGQDGTTPHIGENGNWYIGEEDTGVAAQGSALVINNTATVGQTIRIAAIDETGQPIEWEATDMPSGSGSVTSSDDGDGNVTLTLSGGISVSDDGVGNVTIT